MPIRSRHRLLIAGLCATAAIAAFGRLCFDYDTRSRIDDLHAAVNPRTSESVQHGDFADLPDPIRRYFETVIDEGQQPARAARVTQAGEFRLGDSWKPMRATQHYTVSPPGFVWDAEIDVLPFVPARVVDAYEAGQGSLQARVLSTIPVADVEPSPDMNEAELQRYLAEAVWFPTALLPSDGVEWTPIDEHSARARLTDHGTTAEVVFHVDDDGLVEQVTAERYRQENDSHDQWTGHFDDYEWHDGVQIPTTASVEWNLADGDQLYWRATLTGVDHQRY
ncbi:DUF6920 family protein [Haloarchaeobius sp. DFWS5]|uniref:DUF6920 family protein n=1 Tax=Haloarchaeobius sp. DFWS5 TaxID=3446114 RepID=UPI003EC0A1A6